MIKQLLYVLFMCIVFLYKVIFTTEITEVTEIIEDEITEIADIRIGESIMMAQDIINETLMPYSTEVYAFEGHGNQYEQCTDEVKAVYDEMLTKIENFEYFCYSIEDGYTYEDLDNVFIAWAALMEDHPYLDLYFMINEIFDQEDFMTTALESAYYLPYDFDTVITDSEELARELAIFDAECELVVNGINPEWSTYDKYRYLATVISLRTSYDYEFTAGNESSNGYAAIDGGLSICSGYSRAMQFLCEKANLYCKIVSGDCTGTSHAWNLVKLDSGTYYVDVTWSDETLEPGRGDWLEYFMFTEEKAQESRVNWDDVIATGQEQFSWFE